MTNLLIIPGLGDDVNWTKFLTRNWEKNYGIKIHVIAFGWEGDASKFQSRFNAMEKNLDALLEKEENVSLLGISAGGSAVINLYFKKRTKVKKVVTVCGRLNDVNIKPSWKNNAESYRILKHSIKLCEENTNKLINEDKKRILTIRPYYDDIVPVRTMIINGALNEKIYSVQHMISIALGLTFYSKKIADFLKS
jgi:hypothetical protein